jgi:sensor histidine kinase YesM
MTTRYWRYQIIGWLTLLALDFSGKYFANMMMPSLLLAVVALYSFGLIASHGMRHIYKTYCSSLSIAKTIPVAFIVSLIAALLASSALMIVLWISGTAVFTDDNISPIQVFNYNLFLMWLFLSIWAGLYLFVTRQRQVDTLNKQQEHLKDNLQQSQLHALMNQLNPHFMFNCINNIRALILEDKHKARDMLAHMADMLRYNLQDDDKATETLNRELEIAHAFMQLASIQLEERLRFKMEIDPSIDQQILVPRMLIQLLLENAVKHGIAYLPKGGEVSLNTYVLSNKLVLKISNDGTLNNTNTKGIGLKNIRSRLKMLYQNRAIFELSQEGKLVLATVILPMD